MELRVLRYFLTVAREGNMTRAANLLHITQPTLSRQISQLEEELGTKLFDRSSHRMTLTSKGITLMSRASEILAMCDKALSEVCGGSDLAGTISIGCGDLGSTHVVTRLVSDFLKDCPNVRIVLQATNAGHVESLMEHGQIDMGILIEPVNYKRYSAVQMNVRERWVLAMRANDPIAKREGLELEDILGLPLILPTPEAVHGELAEWLGDSISKLDVKAVSNLNTSGMSMVLNGAGYLLCVEGSLGLIDRSLVSCVPLSPQPIANCVLAWRRDRPVNAAAHAFLEFAREELKGGIQDVSFWNL